MRAGGRWALGLLAAVVVLAAPAHAVALDSDLKGSAVFRVEASNGYTIFGFAASETLDGRTDLGLIVSDGRSSVSYVVPAVVTPTRVEADMGDLGRISLAVEPSGVTRTVKSRCGGEPVAVEPDIYRGTFEFRGEEGYAEASATTLPEYTRFLLDVVCPGGGGIGGGGDVPGAKLGVHRGRGHDRFGLEVYSNRPSGRSHFEIDLDEKRGRIEISRTTTIWADASAFSYDRRLRTATLAPPAPFEGRATFHRNAAAPANRWTGNLTADLPGRSDVALVAAGARATLVPFCWHEGDGPFRC